MTSENTWVSTSAPYVAPRREGQADAWTEETASRGRRGTQQILDAGELPAPSEVAAQLGVATGTTVIARRRLILLDETAVELTDTYYPAAIAAGTRLARTGKIRGGAVTLLAELGFEPHRVHEEVYARMPDATERRVLDLGDDQPVLCLTRVTEDGNGLPFQVDRSVFAAAEQRLRYDVRIG